MEECQDRTFWRCSVLSRFRPFVGIRGQFYALFFLQNVLKVDAQAANIMVAIALALGTMFFVVFGWLSDKIGRKPIIMAGLLLAMLTYFPLFKAMTWAGNPALAEAQATVKATVTADPADCNFQFNPTGTAKFTTSCDIATALLTKNSVPYEVVPGAAGSTAAIKLGNAEISSYDSIKAGANAKALDASLQKSVNIALHDAGYPLVRDCGEGAGCQAERLHCRQSGTEAECRKPCAAVRSTTVPTDKLVADKLLTADEAAAAGMQSMPVYTIAMAVPSRWWPIRPRSNGCRSWPS